MPLFRIRDILPVIAPYIRGTGVDITCDPEATKEAIAAYNRINELLMNRQDWPGTEAIVRFPAHSGIIVLPERFESIKAVSIDCHPSPVFPVGWQFLESGPGERLEMKALQHLGSMFPTERDLPGVLPIFAVSDKPESKKAALLVTGYDAANKQVSVSVPIAQASPSKSAKLTTPMRSIMSVAKTPTNGYVDIGAWNDVTGPFWLSRLEPADESPCFTRYCLPGIQSSCHCIVANVSMRFRDLSNLDDISLIQHREAYRFAAQGINAFDDNNGALGSEFMGRAIKLLKDRVAKLEIGQRQALNISSSRRLTSKKYNNRRFR